MNISDLKGKRIVFAASGGLDSCTATRWLTDHGVEVLTVTADLGQPDEVDLGTILERMRASGARDTLLLDLKAELAAAGLKCLQAMAAYEGGYWNTTAIARHVTVEGLVRVMREQNITVMAHGATGRGNDQVRFALATHMIAPDIQVYAPWRDEAFISAFGGRSQMITFCEQKGIPITSSREKPYSTDANLLGLTHEAGRLEYLDTAADFVTPVMGCYPEKAPEKGETVTVEFEKGVPVKFNGASLDPVQMFLKANAFAGRHGIGIGIHVIENRFVGIKSRGVYESPGLTLLSVAYGYCLQQLLDRRARKLFDHLSVFLAEQIYQGYFFDLGSRMALEALHPLNRLMTGSVTIHCYKGNIRFASASPMSHGLYDPEIASMEAVGDFQHADSEGFLRVLGVHARALGVKGQSGN